MCLTLFAGCALFTQSTAEGRAQVAMVVDGEEITLGQFLDTFNNLYNNYYYYIYYGQYTVSDIAQMSYDTLVNSYLILSDYKKMADRDGLTYVHPYTGYKDAKYLSEQDMEYIMKGAKKSVYASFDNSLETLVKNAGYDLKDASEEETGRTAPTYETITSIIDVKLSITNKKEIDDYLATTAGGTASEYWTTADGYIFADASSQALLDRVAALNGRITLKEGQEAVTAEQYIKYQKEAVASIKQSIYTSYGLDLDKFVTMQIESTVNSRIINSAAAKIFQKDVESDIDGLLLKLQKHYATNKQSAVEQYTINPSAYATLVEGLKNTSVIYNIPTEYQGKYIFVKNLLVPFSEEQLKHLTEKEKELKEEQGDDYDEAEYLAYREQYAANIVLENFLTGQNTSNVFTYNGTTKKIEIKAGTVLSNGLNAVNNGNDFTELMYKYNSDSGQFENIYDYVVRIGAPDDYTAKWVEEFVVAAEEAYAEGEGGIGAAVSKYGVHIVYFDSVVAEQQPSFTRQNIFDTGTFEHRYYSAYYDAISGAYVNDQITNLRKTVNVTPTKALKNFLASNSLTVDTNID